MTFMNNRKITICTAGHRTATKWPSSVLFWSEFVEKLKTPQRSTETLEEYLKMTKTEQDRLKDVGGFVGGYSEDGSRAANKMLGRDLIALDFDNIAAGATDTIIKATEALGCAYVIYSTRKHAEYKPRLRVVIPSDRTMFADEYEPIARRVAYMIGIGAADPTTFQVNRLMYWPSVSSDSEYVYMFGDKPFMSADGILKMYSNWQDVREWPQVPGYEVAQQRLVARQQDPTTKQGIVGAFCRTYNILSAMETFIPNAYDPTDKDDRYTYTGGSTTGGVIIYNNGDFAYSHHATDPIGGKLVNAFDLVRLHLFGDLDEEARENTPGSKLPSYTEMKRLAISDRKVSDLLGKERFELAKETFSDNNSESTNSSAVDLAWLSKLSKNPNTGRFENSISNIVTVLENDPLLKGKIALDEFANRGLATGALPWDKRNIRRNWSDTDDAGIRMYLETYYQITGQTKIADALLLVSRYNLINDVRDYLTTQKWDGKCRLDTLLTDYLGADDTPYTRAVCRKSLVAAVARIISPGIKYDYMPILTGPQGIGKSTFLGNLAGEWFSDSLASFSGKDAAEMLQGVWINEVGELTAFSRAETNQVKQFLSKREDIYREAYGRRTNRFKRQCVFFGTSNDAEFLKDSTGNRRFWPVEVGVIKPIKSVWDDLRMERDQIWAEAYMRFVLGEKLYLSHELEELAREQQDRHKQSNAKEGIIEKFLNIKVPVKWEEMPINERKMFFGGGLKYDGDLMYRDKICAAEIWVECFNSDLKYMRRMDAVEINNILESLCGWKRNKSKRRYGPFGQQRGFDRVKNIAKNSTNVIDFTRRQTKK